MQEIKIQSGKNKVYAYVWTLLSIVTVIVAFIILEGVKHTNDTEVRVKQVEVQR